MVFWRSGRMELLAAGVVRLSLPGLRGHQKLGGQAPLEASLLPAGWLGSSALLGFSQAAAWEGFPAPQHFDSLLSLDGARLIP